LVNKILEKAFKHRENLLNKGINIYDKNSAHEDQLIAVGKSQLEIIFSYPD